MKRIPNCEREFHHGKSRIVPRPEKLLEHQARADDTARALVRMGYRAVGIGNRWKFILDPGRLRGAPSKKG